MINTNVMSIGTNIASCFLYDVLKQLGTETEKVDLESKICDILDKSGFSEELSSIESFCNLYSTKRDFYNFFHYTIFNAKLKDRIQDKILTKDEFIKMMVIKGEQYIELNYGKIINKIEFSNFINSVIDLIEQYLIEQMNYGQMGETYFLALKIGELKRMLLDSSNSKTIKNITNYENIREKYISIMKNINKTSYIYGKGTFNFYDIYVFPKFKIKLDEMNYSQNKESIEWQDIFTHSNNISIVGGPGFGKSLFLSNLINKFEELNIIDSKETFPIYCNLKDYSRLSKGKVYSMFDFFESYPKSFFSESV